MTPISSKCLEAVKGHIYHRDEVLILHHEAQVLRPFQWAIAAGSRCESAIPSSETLQQSVGHPEASARGLGSLRVSRYTALYSCGMYDGFESFLFGDVLLLHA